MSNAPLRREIGLFGAVMLVIGGIVGVGVFVNPAVVAKSLHSPPLILAVWSVGGIVALLGAFVYAELADRMPDTGGEFVYLTKTYGPMVGFLFGWTSLLVVQAGGMAAVAMTFARYFLILTGLQTPEFVVVVVVLGGLALTNCLGVKSGNGTQALLGLLKLAAIAGLVGCGLFLAPVAHPLLHPVLDRPVSPGLAEAFGAALIPVVFAFGGWQTANFVGGEIRDPRRNLTRALVIGVLAVTALYLAVNIACLHSLGAQDLGRTKTPASDVLSLTVGPLGARLAAAAIALSTLGYLSQSLLTSPRVYFAMAREGFLFKSLGEVSARTGAPVMAILVTAVWTGVLSLLPYESILAYVVAINFLFFGLSGFCLFVLRARAKAAGGEVEAGFRAPWHPWSTGAFVLACAVVVAASFVSHPVESLIGYGFLALGIPVYFLRRRLAPVVSEA